MSLNSFVYTFSLKIDSDTEKDRSKASGSHNNNNSKNKRYFWQYNVQAKGPKGQRLVIKTQLEDPHVLNEITDPVFSPTCSVRGIKVPFTDSLLLSVSNTHSKLLTYSIVERHAKVMVMI